MILSFPKIKFHFVRMEYYHYTFTLRVCRTRNDSSICVSFIRYLSKNLYQQNDSLTHWIQLDSFASIRISNLRIEGVTVWKTFLTDHFLRTKLWPSLTDICRGIRPWKCRCQYFDCYHCVCGLWRCLLLYLCRYSVYDENLSIVLNHKYFQLFEHIYEFFVGRFE